MTHRLNYGSLAIDAAVTPCPDTDARGIPRPQNGRCDMGAFEFVGPPPPADDVPPETEFVSGPIQNTLETVQWRFTGSDNQTATEDLNYECRLYEVDLVEEPEIIAPWDPIPPELQWVGCNEPVGVGCSSARRVSRASRCGPSTGTTTSTRRRRSRTSGRARSRRTRSSSRSRRWSRTAAPRRSPSRPSTRSRRRSSWSTSAASTRRIPSSGSSASTRRSSATWRAARTRSRCARSSGGSELVDPTPARYTWTVGQGPNCDTANITLTAVADGWVDEVNPIENYLFETELGVASGATGDPDAVPPEPAHRRERALALPLRAADRRGALHARVGDAAPLQRRPRGGTHAHPGHAARRARSRRARSPG